MQASASTKTLPRDARLISLIMASMGVDDAEPGTLALLLEFTHRWTADILSETLVYHDHASKPSQPSTGPTLEDLRVAIQSKIDLTCTNAWPKEYLTGLAQNLNKLPLPEIKDNPGIGLPPEQDRLTGVNFDLRPRPAPPIFERPAALPSDDEEEDESMMDASAALDGDMSVDPDASAASLNGGAATNGKRARSESDDEPENFEEV